MQNSEQEDRLWAAAAPDVPALADGGELLEDASLTDAQHPIFPPLQRHSRAIKRLERQIQKLIGKKEPFWQKVKHPKRPIISVHDWVSHDRALWTAVDELRRIVSSLEDGIAWLAANATGPESDRFNELVESVFIVEEDLSELWNELRITEDLNESVYELEQDVRNLEQDLTLLRRANHTAAERITLLQRKLSEPSPEQYRLTNVIAASSQVSPPRLKGDIDYLHRILKKDGLLFRREVLRECVSLLEDGRPLILQGPPGTGKTNLARKLPSAFEGSAGGEIQTVFAEANEHWSSFDVLGGLLPNGASVVPRIGVLTDAVATCIETKGRAWLIIDELNRADVDKAFSGVMALLSDLPNGGQLIHPALKQKIKVPSSFRLICTMNDAEERHLFPISEAFASRFSRVPISPPPMEMHLEILSAQLAELLSIPLKKEDSESIRHFAECLASLHRVSLECRSAEVTIGVRQSRGLIKTAFVTKQTGLLASLDRQLSSVISRVIKDIPTPALRTLIVAMERHRTFSATLVAVHQEQRSRMQFGT